MFPNLFHLLRTRKPARRLPRRYPFRPILEGLETRWLPSSITWTAQSDGDFNNQNSWTVDGTNPPEHRVPGPDDRANIPGSWTVTSARDNTVDSLSAGPFRITGGTFTVNNLFNNSGIGTLVLSGGSLVTANNETDINGGTLSATLDTAANATLRFRHNTTVLNPGTVLAGPGRYLMNGDVFGGPEVSVNATLDGPQTFELANGNLDGTGTFNVDGAFSVTSGSGGTSISGGLTVNFLPDAVVTLGVDSQTLNLTAATVTNYGTVNWTGKMGFNINSGAHFVNAQGDLGTGVFNDLTANNHSVGGGSGTFDNDGVYFKNSDLGGSTDIGVAFNNTGTVEVAGGTLILDRGGTATGSFTVDAGATLTVNGHSFDYILADGAQVAGDGQLRLTDGEMDVNTAISISNLDMAGGTLGGTGDLAITGAFTWSGGSTMGGSGTTTVLAGGSFAITGSSTKTLTDTRTLINATDAGVWSGSGSLNLGSRFENLGTFTVATDASLNAAFGRIDNSGTWIKTSDQGRTTIIDGPFNNTGTVEVASGGIQVNRGGTNTGLLSLDGGSFYIAGGSYTLADGTVITGASPLVTAGGTLSITAAITVANFTLSGGTLSGPGSLTVSGGTFDWTGGTVQNLTGNLAIAADGTLTVEGSAGKNLNSGTITVDGVVNWSGGNINFSGAATFEAETDGSFNILSDAINLTGGGTFRNRGLVTKQNLPGTTQFAGSIAFLNDDPGAFLEVASGILQIDNFTQNAGTTGVAAGATLASGGSSMTLQGGELTGAGTVMVNQGNGTLVNVAGTISPGGDGGIGTLTIAGSLTNQALGVVNIDIDGTSPGTYDQLIVTGTVTLNGGTVNVTFGPDYSPSGQDSFTVLVSQWGVINGNPGDFEVYNVNGLDPSYQMAHGTAGGSLTLTVQPAAGAPGMADAGMGKHRRDGFGAADEAFLDFAPTW